MVANIDRIGAMLIDEAEGVPDRADGYRSRLTEVVTELLQLEEQHRVERLDINKQFEAAFDGLGRMIDLPEDNDERDE